MDKGFIKLNRKFFSHKMWEAARTFSECEAWIDLIQSARFEATEQIERIGGREICFGRGQYPASNRYLARKWGWGEQKVKTFLSKLKIERMIKVDTSQGMNVITLCKYNIEQSMASNWNGLFELKEQKNAEGNQIKSTDGKRADYSIGM